MDECMGQGAWVDDGGVCHVFGGQIRSYINAHVGGGVLWCIELVQWQLLRGKSGGQCRVQWLAPKLKTGVVLCGGNEYG